MKQKFGQKHYEDETYLNNLNISFFLKKNSLAQADTSKTSFLSKLYFPFDFGYTLSEQKGILNGGQVKTGLEYRMKKENGLFFRFNFELSSTDKCNF